MSRAATLTGAPAPRDSFTRLVAWDLRLAARERLTWIVLAVLGVAFALAIASGERAAADQRAVVAQAVETATKADTDLREKLAAGDPQVQAPDRLRTHVALPPAPAGALVTSRTRLEPTTAETNAFGQAHRLFRDYQVDNPWALKLGSFDVALVLVYLVPLLIVAVGASAVSADRGAGLDRLLAVHGPSPGRLLASRIAARALLVGVPALALTLLAGVLAGAPLDRLAAVLLLASLSMAVWWAMVALVAARVPGPEAAALALLLLWAALSIVVPTTLASLIQAANPPPSRITWITTARAAEIQALNTSETLVGRFMTDHPELEPGGVDIPARTKARLVVAREVDAAVAPIQTGFDDAMARQQRWAGLAQALSPALALERALMTVAGTGVERHRAFQTQAHAHARAWQDQVGDLIMAGQPVTMERLDQLPRFTFQEPGWVRASASGALVLLVWLGGALLLAQRRRPLA
jgi:ABC-2 type transport system permease protein